MQGDCDDPGSARALDPLSQATLRNARVRDTEISTMSL